MSKLSPLGKNEHSRLEFMGVEALRVRGSIAKGVVAMLNAGGGEIWIGVREERNRAVAVEGVPDADQEGRSLRAFLADTIEPSPATGEIQVDAEPWGSAKVLHIKASPANVRGPYAYLENGGRYFVTRQGSHNRWMDRDEILGQVATAHPRDLAVLKAVSAEQKQAQEDLQENDEGLFWLRLQPTGDLHLKLEDVEQSDLLVDPTSSGNRRVGFVSIATIAGFGPRINRTTPGGIHLEVGRRGNTWLRIFEDGGILFTAPLIDFRWLPRRPGDPDRLLWPYAVLEYPISVFRIAARLYSDYGHPDAEIRDEAALVAHLAIFNLAGWTLRPGSPLRWLYRPPEPIPYTRGEDFILERPLTFPLEEIKQPDGCGFRLIQRLYEAFGFSRDQIPQEFNQKAGRLVLPE